MKFLFISGLLTFCATVTLQAQSKEKKAKTDQTFDNAFAPAKMESTATKSAKKTKSKKNKQQSFNFARNMDVKVREFENRMEANSKRDKKEQKLKEKPQYSDPLYFGHKKKPKKRPPKKRKFCKECGIVH